MKLESVEPMITLSCGKVIAQCLLINGKKEIEITDKELSKIEKWIKEGDKITNNIFSGNEKLKKKFIDFIAKKKKRRQNAKKKTNFKKVD